MASAYEPCVRPGCSERSVSAHGFCPADWKKLPPDLRERWRWAQKDGEELDRAATLEQLAEALRD